MSAHRENLIKAVQKLRAILLRKKKQPEEKRIESHENKNDADNIGALVAALNRIGDQNDAAANQQTAKWIRDETRECWRIWLEVSAIVAAFIAAGGIFLQQCTMQGTLDEMHAEQRPWVYTEIVGADSPMSFNGSSIRLDLHYALKNVGKSAALNTRVYALVLLSALAPEGAPEEDYWGRIKSTSELSKIFGGKTDITFDEQTETLCSQLAQLDMLKQRVRNLREQRHGHHVGYNFFVPGPTVLPGVPEDGFVSPEPFPGADWDVKEPYVPLILICVRYTDTAGKLIGTTGEFYMAYRIDQTKPDMRLPMDPTINSLPEKQIGFRMDRRSAQ